MQDECNLLYVIMKTMCSPGYHCNGFVTTHALWQMIYIYFIHASSTHEIFDKERKKFTSIKIAVYVM